MKIANRTLVTTLALACAALAWWNWRLSGQVRELTEEREEMQPKLEQAMSRVRTLAADAKMRRAQAGATDSASTDPDPTSTAESESPPEHKRNFHPEEITAMVKNPAMQTMIASQQGALVQTTYRDLMERFRLSPEERDYMQKLLTERQMSLVTLGMQIMNPELSPEQRRALGLQLRDAETSAQAKIRDFLNDDADYAYYQAYAGQEPERREVGMFESSLASAESLDPAKADALANLMNETRKQYPFTVDFYNQENFGRPQNLNPAAVNKFLDEQARYQDDVIEKVSGLLTPVQLEAFKQNQAGTRQMMKMQLNSILQMAGNAP